MQLQKKTKENYEIYQKLVNSINSILPYKINEYQSMFNNTLRREGERINITKMLLGNYAKTLGGLAKSCSDKMLGISSALIESSLEADLKLIKKELAVDQNLSIFETINCIEQSSEYDINYWIVRLDVQEEQPTTIIEDNTIELRPIKLNEDYFSGLNSQKAQKYKKDLEKILAKSCLLEEGDQDVISKIMNSTLGRHVFVSILEKIEKPIFYESVESFKGIKEIFVSYFLACQKENDYDYSFLQIVLDSGMKFYSKVF